MELFLSLLFELKTELLLVGLAVGGVLLWRRMWRRFREEVLGHVEERLEARGRYAELGEASAAERLRGFKERKKKMLEVGGN